MKIWIILAIVAVLVVAGVVAVNANQTEPIGKNQKTKSCTSCGNSCTAGNNCGLSGCQALQGKPCSCGKQ